MDARAALFPADDLVVPLSMSALDRAWLDAVEEIADPSAGVFVSAEGLFMYLEREDVLALVAECARRFPGGRLFFDSIPHWFSRRTLAGLNLTPRYTAPRMPTAFTPAQTAQVFGALPGVGSVAAWTSRSVAGRGAARSSGRWRRCRRCARSRRRSPCSRSTADRPPAAAQPGRSSRKSAGEPDRTAGIR